jgi:SAM-dependent MidA family methyltransferase
MELALYDPEFGFYAAGVGAAGRRHGDFLTSVEVGPLFGAVLARALDTWWDELDRPDPFVVVEAAAGRGMLARTVLAAAPRCAPALTYVLVERSATLRAEQARYLSLDRTVRSAGPGPRVVSLTEVPVGPLTGVIVANELLDNLPAKVMQLTDRGWYEVRLAAVDDDPERGELTEVLVPASEEIQRALIALVPDAAVGSRLPWQHRAASWVSRALEALDRGRVVIFDYGRPCSELAAVAMSAWLRTYRAQGRGGDPFTQLGTQDITVDVAIDQLERAVGGFHESDQASFLGHHGIEALVADGRRIWHERAAIGDLAAMRARSRVSEAEALVDPTGFGSFRVLQWQVGS